MHALSSRAKSVIPGASQGHYICDVRNPVTRDWFRTNDNKEHKQIMESEVIEAPSQSLIIESENGNCKSRIKIEIGY